MYNLLLFRLVEAKNFFPAFSPSCLKTRGDVPYIYDQDLEEIKSGVGVDVFKRRVFFLLIVARDIIADAT